MTADNASPKFPEKRYADDAGWDLFASRDTVIPPGVEIDVHTDIAIAIPNRWYAQIKTRSSTMKRTGLMVLEGVIDQTYRGELFFMVYNTTNREVTIKQGDRLAQLLFLPVPEVVWYNALELPPSVRGSQGFGSSGR
jgi:dUTP pyrophosphatase